VGDKTAARLLAAIGDPYWHTVQDRPRTVSELWAYCGLHVEHAGVAPRRRKGEQANWSTAAKTRSWLIAEACVKQLRAPCTKAIDKPWAEHLEGCACSPYRLVYDEARIKYHDAVHVLVCARCGPKGVPGLPLSDGHQHARAMRFVAKRFLRDLWREAKRLHELSLADAPINAASSGLGGADHMRSDIPTSGVGTAR
jgi:hypothetical protein